MSVEIIDGLECYYNKYYHVCDEEGRVSEIISKIGNRYLIQKCLDKSHRWLTEEEYKKMALASPPFLPPSQSIVP